MEAIIFKDINDKFAFGMYLDIEVIIMKENGYMNVSRLANDIAKKQGKNEIRFRNWTRSEQVKKYIEAVERRINQSEVPALKRAPIIDIKNTTHDEQFLRGQYADHRIVTHFTSWCDPEIGLTVADIVQEYYINKYNKISKEEKEKIITPYVERINEQENIIDEQKNIIDEKDNEIERKNTFLIEQLELLIVSRINETHYYFNRIQTIRQKKTLKTNEDRGYTHIKTIPLSRNSVFVFNKMMKDLNIRKTYNIVTYEEPIENLIEEIENYIETYN